MNTHSNLTLTLQHLASRCLHRYADWRVGATESEKRCYKLTDSVLLTFDDYGSSAQIDSLLATLQAKQVRAMFFFNGDWAQLHPEQLAKVTRAGHILGNHTLNHHVLTKLSRPQIEQEVRSGVASQWLRPPYGRYDHVVRRVAAGLGYRICYWSIDSRDWTGASLSAMRHTILNELQAGAVILFHAHAAHTAAALPSLIDDIRHRGYQLTDFDEADWA